MKKSDRGRQKSNKDEPFIAMANQTLSHREELGENIALS